MTESKSIVFERALAHPPEKVWRALTQPHLIAEWMQMHGDFRPETGHRFAYETDWGAVRGEVLEADAPRSLSYTWGDDDLKSVVTWTLAPDGAGTRLRMADRLPARPAALLPRRPHGLAAAPGPARGASRAARMTPSTHATARRRQA